MKPFVKTLVIALVSVATAIGTLSAQNITLKAQNAKISQVMQMLQRQYSYSFSIHSSRIDVNTVISIDVRNEPIESVLEKIFKGQNAEFRINDKRIAVIEKPAAASNAQQNSRPAKPATAATAVVAFECKGVVTDENNSPVIGASVVEVNGNPASGTSTDINGAFAIKLSSEQAIVEVSFIGYKTQQIVVGGRRSIAVQLKPDTATSINEIVVIGYGAVKKGDLTGSVANLKMNDMYSVPALSIDDAMQGRVAGVDIMSTSGDPAATSSIRIRGSRSISASNEPLIVVDGVIDAVQSLSDINSDDIESVSVLKDASSTAIYGSRGSNGVIIVTTRQAKQTATKASVNVKAQFGISMLARKLDLMNAQEFAQYRNDYVFFRSGDGFAPSTPLEDYGTYINPMSVGKGTSWVDEITRIAPYQNYNVSLAGRVKKFRYYSSVGYTNKRGIVDGSGVQRVTGRINFDYDVAKWLSVGYRGAYTFADEDQNRATIGGTNPWDGAIYLNPLLTPQSIRNEIYENSPIINNPRYCIDLITKERERLTGRHTAVFTITPVKNLVIKSQNSYMSYARHDYQFFPNALPKRTDEEGSGAYRYEGDSRSLTSENTISYSLQTRSGHYFDVMAGFTASRSTSHSLSVNADGLISESMKWGDLGSVIDKDKYKIQTTSSIITKESVLLRMNYNYKKRYYLTFTGRVDGSSNFAKNNKWGVFPSGAFRWNISNENFMKGVKWVDELSLRMSVGRTGNDAIAAYRALEAVRSNSAGYIFGGTQSVAFYPSRLANDNLTWETTDAYNIALDAALFGERLKFTIEGYYAKTSDLLLTVQTGDVTGYQNRYENLGRTTNKGVEFSIESRNIDHPKFQWTTALTLSHNKQMVDDIGNESSVVALAAGGNGYMMYGYKKGYPLNSLWGFKYGGVWKNDEEIEANATSKSYVSTYYKHGHPRYADINHDGALSADDLVYQGSADPVVYGGFQNTFYIAKHLKIGVFFNYSIGGKIYNYSELYMAGSYQTNQYRKMLNSWHPVRNPNSNIPRAGTTDRMLPSDFQIYDASYLRLKSVNVSYTFDLRKKVKWLRDITVGVSGENLWLWSKYSGFDPDVSTESGSSALRRIDLGAYPKARMIVFNLQIRY